MYTQNSPLPLCTPLLTACALFILTTTSSAVLVAGWDFQGTTNPGGPIGTVISMPPSTPRVFTANAGVFQSTSTLYLDGTNGSSSFFVGTSNADAELGSLNSITANTEGTNFSLATGSGVGGGSLAFFNRTAQGGIDGKSVVFKLSMSGYEALQFSFAVQRPSSANDDYGVSLFTLSYSLDGSTFLPWGSIDTGFGAAITNQAFTLSPVLDAANNAETLFVKMTMSGSTGGINSTRVDNVQFNATAVPEPGTGAISLAAAGLWLGRRRPRKR